FRKDFLVGLPCTARLEQGTPKTDWPLPAHSIAPGGGLFYRAPPWDPLLPRQAVAEMDPGELLVGMDMSGGCERRGILQAADHDVSLGRPTHALIGELRAAASAEAALHARG